MADSALPPPSQQPVVQGAGNWANYVGAGLSNLTDPARVQALQQAGNAAMAWIQNPTNVDAVQEYNKMYSAFVQPAFDSAAMANIPLTQIASQYGERVASGVQSYFTANPTAKAQEIQQQYGERSSSILGSSGIQSFMGTTVSGERIYSGAGTPSTPFQSNVLTEYQQKAVDLVTGAGLVTARAAELGFVGAGAVGSVITSGLGSIRGLETTAPLVVGRFQENIAPYVQSSVPSTPEVTTSLITPTKAQGNFITDFFGGFAKSGYGAGVSAIGAPTQQTYTPVYETLMARSPTPQVDLGIGIRGALDIGGGILAAGRSAVGGIIPSVSAAESVLTSSPFVSPTAKQGGVDIGSPMVTASAAAPSAVVGSEVYGPFRTTKEAIGAGSIAEAARIDVVSRPGYIPGAKVGSQQWAQNLVELSESYHTIAEKTGVQQRANPFEYTGDLALSYLKGTNKGSSSSTYGENITDTSILKLPGGFGVQDIAWKEAEAGRGGERAAVEIPKGFETAVSAIEASKGQYGPYGQLYGGPEYERAVVAPAVDSGMIRGGKVIAGVPTIEGVPASAPSPVSLLPPVTRPSDIALGITSIFGGGALSAGLITVSDFWLGGKSTLATTSQELPKTVTTEVGAPTVEYRQVPGGIETTTITPSTTTTVGGTALTTVATPLPSGLEALNKSIRETLNLPSPEMGEKALAISSLAIPTTWAMTIPGAVETAITGKETSTKLFNPFAGQYTQFYEQPLLTPLSYGAGALFGTAAKGIEEIYIGSRGLAAEAIISKGGAYRVAEQVGSVVMERAPQVLGALYAVDVGSRVTSGFTNISPEVVAPRLRGVVMQEVVPMGAGFGLPSQVIKAGKNIGFEIADIRQNIAAERSAAYGTSVSPESVGLTDVFKYRYGPDIAAAKLQGMNIIGGVGEGITIRTPATIGFGETWTSRFGEYARNIPSTVSNIIGIGKAISPEVTRGYYPYEGIESVYPKTRVPSGQEILTTGYSKYFDVRASAIEAGRGAIGSLRGFGEVIAGTPTGEATIENRWRAPITAGDILYGKTLSRIIPPSTYGEVPAPTAGIPFTQGTEKGGDITKGTGPSTGGVGRITATKVVGGRTIPALAKEPSLRSMESTVPSGGIEARRVIGTTQDFRGRPVSSTMKPMGKQAAGVSLLTEELPKVEGMPQGRVAASASPLVLIPSLPAVSRSVGAVETTSVSITEPSLEFGQQARKASEILPVAFAGIESRFGKETAQVPFTEIVSGVRQASFVEMASDIMRTSKTESMTSLDRLTDLLRTPSESTREDIRLGSRVSYDIMRDTITGKITTQEPKITYDIKTTRDIITTTVPPVTLPGWFSPAGGGAGGAPKGRRKRQLETFYIGPRSYRIKLPKLMKV